MKLNNFLTWIALGLFLNSVASYLKYKEEGAAWRHQLSLAASILFFILFLLSLYTSLKKKKKE